MQRKCEALLVGENVLAERGAKLREPLDNIGEPRLRFAVERGAGAAKRCVIALEHALLLGGKVERFALTHQGVDAAEEPRIGVELVPVACDLRSEFALDGEQRVVAVGAGQKMEHLLDPRERPPAQFERRDRVGKIRWFRIGCDGRHFRFMFGKGARIGRGEMLGLDGIEWRGLARGVPGAKEGVIAVFLGAHAGFYQGKVPVLYRGSGLELAPRFGESAPALEKAKTKKPSPCPSRRPLRVPAASSGKTC